MGILTIIIGSSGEVPPRLRRLDESILWRLPSGGAQETITLMTQPIPPLSGSVAAAAA